MTTGVTTYRFTVEEFVRMGEAGIFGEDDRVELIEGEIIEMAPIGSRHAACVNSLTMALAVQVTGQGIVSVQNPVHLLPRSMPQPDLILLRPRLAGYWSHPVEPADVLLAIEVADTSLDYDLATKGPLYARYGIGELWVWDLQGRRVHRFRTPAAGSYRDTAVLGDGATLEVAALPGVVVAVSDGLGPADVSEEA